MGKFFSIVRNQKAVFGTLLVLLFLAIAYLYIYIPANEKTVQERHFRCLQNIDRNIHNKIENSDTLINNLLAAYGDIGLDSLQNYISHYSKDQFTLLGVNILDKADKNSSVTILSDANLQKFSLFENVKIPFRTIDTTEKKQKINQEEFILRQLKKKGPPDSVSFQIGIQFKIKQFIRPLLIHDVFDHYVIFYNSEGGDKKPNVNNVMFYNSNGNEKEKEKENVSNKVVYESFPSGLSFLKKDSILQTKNGIVTPGIRSLNLSGVDYKVFTQAINVDANSEFIIAGLVSDKNYQKEKNQLPSWLILLLLTAALGTIVSLPWLKLYQMGNKDKLTVADGIASVLVSMFLMALLFFVILNYTFSFALRFNSDYHRDFDSSKDHLANKIISSFSSELNSARNVLMKFDTIHNHFENNNIVNLGKPHIDFAPEQKETRNVHPNYHPFNGSDLPYLRNLNPYGIAVKEAFWLDNEGFEKDNWNTQGYNPPHARFKERDYFKALRKDSFNFRSDTPFYVDQLISKTRNIFTSLIAVKKSKGNSFYVASLTFNARSLDSVVMPDGFQFAIIDNKGTVRYHSIASRNLNENLKKEFADSSKLVSCLEAASETTFDAEYYGKLYRVKIKPFTNLPYFVVIFEDDQYADARDTEPYAFSFFMLLCFMGFVLLQYCIVFLASSKRTFFKRQFFDTSWIAPNTLSHHEYNITSIANALIVILLLIVLHFSTFLTYVYLLLYSVTLSGIFLAVLFLVKYKKIDYKRYRIKKRVTQCLSCFIVLIDLAAWNTLDSGTSAQPNYNFIILILFELLLLAGCAVIYFAAPPALKWLKKKREDYLEKRNRSAKSNWNFKRSFALMVTTRLIITSGVPVAFFFIVSFNYEQNLDIRYKQLNFAKSLFRKISPMNINEAKMDIIANPSNTEGIYPDSIFVKDTIKMGSHSLSFNTLSKKLAYTKEELTTVKVLDAFRLLMSNAELRSNNLGFPPHDNTFAFDALNFLPGPEKAITSTYYKITPSNNDYITISSSDINYPLKKLAPLLIPLVLISLFIFYNIIVSIVGKLFAMDLPNVDAWGKIDDTLLLNDKLNQLLLIVGPPGSGKLSKLKRAINKGQLFGNEESKAGGIKTRLILDSDNPVEKNVFIADMILIPVKTDKVERAWEKCKKDALKKENALVIINHFEYNIKDPAANKIKLDFLEALMQAATAKVIIVSTVHPLSFLDSFSDQQYKNSNNNQPQKESVEQRITESELERWHVLLGHFRIIIEPLQDNSNSLENEGPENKDLLKETQYAHYLKKMRPLILKSKPLINEENEDAINESLIFKLQITSHYFYTYIWQSLTKEEKFLLYDLAEDGLVNAHDDYNFSMLICKGLIIKPNGVLTIFNKGFRNFILTAIGNIEVQRIQDQVKDTGKWGSVKGPLTVAIIAILVFLMTSQQEVYTKVIAYITTFGAGVPAVLSIFSLFGKSGGQKAA